EAPLAALGARAAARAGGRLFVAGAGERFLGDVAERVLPVHPARLGAWLESLAKLDAGDPATGAIAGALRDAKQPGILAGGDLIDGRAITALVQLGCGIGGHARLGFVFPGPNGFGAAAACPTPGLPDALDALARGALRAAVVVESDLERLSPARVAQLAGLELLIVIDHAPGALVEAAHVLLPAATPYESDGTYVNRAGRAQAFVAARAPGESVRDMQHDELFPRRPRRVPPESDPRPAWWALERLREAALGQPAARTLPQLRGDLALGHPFWAPLGALAPGDTGVVLDPGAIGATAPPVADFAAPAGGALALFHRDRTLGSEPLSSRSHEMAQMAGPPVALISPADARRLGLAPAADHANGAPARVALTVGGRALELAARVLDAVPEGALIVPRDALPELPAQGAAVEAHAAAAAATTGGGAC
ncbi:MAG TPA: molybdopterin-dependent oxidoreductase, partial [Candidatus Eisenbacteria bacterium]|nr:molybdopterin-dependent oxidoreductase [Candidatus Eisenbacteria bacterium]